MKSKKVIAVITAFTAAIHLAVAQDADVNVEHVEEVARAAAADARRQVEAQRSEVAKVEKQVAEARKAISVAQSKAGEPIKTYNQRLTSVVRRSGPAKALVIPKDAGDVKNVAEIEEDLNTMAYLLEKTSSSDKGGHAMGITIFGAGMGMPSQNLFIDGHGAIFFLSVNYPLLPPPAKEDDSAKAEEKPESEWDVARRELASGGRGSSSNPFTFEERIDVDHVWNVKSSGMEFSAERVEDLKKDLASALKNAANIRKLKGDETVTVVVNGTSTMKIKSIRTAGGGGGEGGGSGTGSGGGGSSSGYKPSAKVVAGEPGPGTPPAKLVMRVRKSDAEAFQNGKLDAEAFRKKVTTMVY